jgi:PAS domain S-box-containing protein
LTGQPSAEEELTTLEFGRCYLKRIFPYRTLEGKIDGIVVTFIDITKRKRAEVALRESEERVRRKLDSIISPEGDIGNLDLDDIIDSRSLQALVDDYYELTGMPMGLLDNKGKVLVGVGWQAICTQFHRVNPETCKNCIESDVQLSAGIPHGEYKIYKCRNNMWDVATPVMVGDRQFGNLFMGQFFFDDEALDYELFRSQARQYGFDEKEYITALEAVPRLSRETLNTSMAFFMKLADILSRLSYSNLKLARSLAERDALMASLRESEERFRTMFERHKAIMLLIEPESGVIMDANSAAVEFYGHSREELRGLKIQELNQLPPEEVAAERQRAVEELRSHFVFPHRIATGEVRWVEVYSTPIEAQGHPLLFSIIHDITERKRAEEELCRSKEEWELTFNSVPDLIAIIDDQHRMVRVNKAMAERLDREPGECLGLTCFEVIHDSKLPPEFCPHSRTMGDGGKYNVELREERLGGDYLVSTTPLLDREGRMTGTVHVARDITEHNRAEVALKRAYDEMEKRVEERTAELRDKDQMLLLQSRQAAMGEMIGNIAHQWRQPLNTLGLTIQQLPLLYDLGKIDRDILNQCVSSSMGLIQHMSRTIDDFRNYFRPDKEKIEFNVHDAIVHTLSLLEGTLQSPQIDITIIAKNDPVIYGYQNEFSQVLLNILMNARDAILERNIADPRVTITIGSEDGRAVVTIADSAGGISKDIINKIFDPYFTTKGPQQGTGVGLFMSKTIIEKNMGGRLSVCNNADGAEFRIEVGNESTI